MGLTLAAGGGSANLIVFLVTVMNIKSINATQINNIVIGCYSLFPVAGAVIADSFFSSFYVVSVFAFVSLLVSLCSLQVCMHNEFFLLCFLPCFSLFKSLYGCL